MMKIHTSMLKDLGINKGDYISVSHSECNYDGKVVVLELDNRFVIRRAVVKGNRMIFYAEGLSPLEMHISESNIYGWVQYVIHPV